jgi:hypothetical protein
MDDDDRLRAQQRLVFGCAWGCGLAAAVGFAGLVAAIALVVPLRPDPGPPAGEGSKIVGQIEAYKSQNGVYPPDLTTAGITPAPNPDGNWHYSPSPNGVRFGLLVWSRNNGRPAVSYAPEQGWRDHPVESD